jgi:hypothetical protein
MDLRESGLIDLAPGLVGVPVVRAAIGVEGTEESLRLSMTSCTPRKLLMVPSSSTKKAEERSLVASSIVTMRSH